MKNQGGKENWYAFLISVVTKNTVTESLEAMEIYTDKTNLIEANRKAAESKLKIPLADIDNVKKLRAEGMSGKQIGKIYGCSDVAVYNFIRNYIGVSA